MKAQCHNDRLCLPEESGRALTMMRRPVQIIFYTGVDSSMSDIGVDSFSTFITLRRRLLINTHLVGLDVCHTIYCYETFVSLCYPQVGVQKKTVLWFSD